MSSSSTPSGNQEEGKSRPHTHGRRREAVPQGGDHGVGCLGRVHWLATLSFVKLLQYYVRSPCGKLIAEWTRTLSSRVAQSTIKAALIVPGGSPQHSLCPCGGIHWISVMNSTRHGNGSSSWTVREKRGGPGITVKRGKKKKT